MPKIGCSLEMPTNEEGKNNKDFIIVTIVFFLTLLGNLLKSFLQS
jgi:hypothetical protein